MKIKKTKVKTFFDSSRYDLDDDINKFLEHVEFVDIKLCVNESDYYHAMVIYKE